MVYDKSLKTEDDKELWKFLQGGVFSDIRDHCNDLRKEGYTKKEIVDYYRPVYHSCNNLLASKGII